MIFISAGTQLDASTPLLVFWAAQEGKLVDLFALSFTIWDVGGDDPVQVYPSMGSQVVDVSTTAGRLSRGHYFATWLVPTTERASLHEIRWSYQFASGGPTLTATTPFEVVTGMVLEPRLLCGLKDLRDEGVSTRFSDARVMQAIRLATKRIQRITERSFFPEARTFNLSGNGSQWLAVAEPIIAIDSIKVLYFGTDLTDSVELDPTTYRVYSRHVSQGMRQPNDLFNPKVEIVLPLLPNWEPVDPPAAWWWNGMMFPPGSQNIQLTGVFGATEYDGTPTGRTPEEISWVCKRLAIAALPKLASAAAASGGAAGSGAPAGPVKRIKTRDQEIEYVGPSSIRVGDITGDVEIDDILMAWRRPPQFSAV